MVSTGNALAEQLRHEDGQLSSSQMTRDQSQARSQSYKELNQRRQRCKDLGRIVQKMTTKKQLMVSSDPSFPFLLHHSTLFVIGQGKTH